IYDGLRNSTRLVSSGPVAWRSAHSRGQPTTGKPTGNVLLAVLGRGPPEGHAELAAELGRVGDPPAGRDGAHRLVTQHRIEQVAAAVLKPTGTDPACDREPFAF